jgi:hypothetical protein
MTAKQKTPLHVVFTMDCVPPGGPEAVPGPKSWDHAERAIYSFAEGLADLDVNGTFFLAPSILKRLDDAADSLRTEGMEPALLCHPQLHEYQSYLGSYSFDRQREIVHLVTQIWQQRRGDPPETFRPGFFSANDYTYQVLCLEGYRQGSCSLPGRIDMEQCCRWDGAFPFPHHTDPLDRMLAGTMEFYEVPVSSDFESRGDPGAEIYTPPHLRIESPCINEHAGELIRSTLSRMAEEDKKATALMFVTHNAVGWGAPEDPHRERLSNLVALLREAAEEHEVELTPATLASVHDYADSVWSGDETLGEL